jgi:hypothetical protein
MKTCGTRTVRFRLVALLLPPATCYASCFRATLWRTTADACDCYWMLAWPSPRPLGYCNCGRGGRYDLINRGQFQILVVLDLFYLRYNVARLRTRDQGSHAAMVGSERGRLGRLAGGRRALGGRTDAQAVMREGRGWAEDHLGGHLSDFPIQFDEE